MLGTERTTLAPESEVIERRSYRNMGLRRVRWRQLLAGTLIATVLLPVLAGPAAATWSIVAVDQETGEVGVAVATCLPADILGDLTSPVHLMTLSPGHGAGISQAFHNRDVPAVMQRMLSDGSTSAEIIAEITAESFDSSVASRQHGVVTIDGQSSGYSGAETLAVSRDHQSDNLSAQGNVLVSAAVIDDAVTAFRDPANPDLTARLVAALQAGSDAGGDSRCGTQTALFAQVAVATVGDDPKQPSVLLVATVDEGSGENPVALLTAEYQRGERRSSVLQATEPSPVGLVLLVGGVLVSLVTIAIMVGRKTKQ